LKSGPKGRERGFGVIDIRIRFEIVDGLVILKFENIVLDGALIAGGAMLRRLSRQAIRFGIENMAYFLVV
jgi:hypothetical protein